MYPPQTSLIPATVSLVRFFFANGFSSFFQNYPYWYLGTTPFRYLIGPVVPFLYQIAHYFAPNAQLFTISIYLVIFGIILSGVGWTLLVSKVFPQKHSFTFYLLPFVLYLVFPWKYITGFAMDELSFFIAKCLLPFGLVAVWSYLKKKTSKSLAVASLVIMILILTHTGVITDIFIGSICLALAASWKEGKIKNIGRRVKSSLLPLGIAFLVSIFWYGPGFWIRILSNPSIGGKSGIGALLGVLGFLRILVPFFLAIAVVYFKSKFTDRFSVFIWSWLGAFFLITLFRFIANPAFYMDWASWFFEVEVGLFLLSFYFISHERYIRVLAPLVVAYLVTLIFHKSLGKPVFFSKNPPQEVNSVKNLSKMAGKNTVFVTGESVFWLNAFTDTLQVRGGRDEVSVNPLWFGASYNFRESQDALVIKKDLYKLNVTYVLVNTGDSKDYYKDFNNLPVWKKLGQVIWSGNGDEIYKIEQ